MNPNSKKLMELAEQCLESAELLIDEDFLLGAVNRAYYAIFDCARALLYEQGISPKTHQGVHTKFSELFIVSGLFESRFNDMLSIVAQMRQSADYDFNETLTKNQAEFALQSAREFRDATRRYFNL